jgi:pilus assembly protein FimV
MPSSGPSPEDGQTSAGSPVTAPSAEQTTVRTDDEGALPAVRAVPERAPLDFAPLDFDLGLPREKEPVVVSEATAPAAIVASSRTEPRIPPPDFSLDFAPLELPSEASTGRADDALSVTGAPVPAAEAEEPVAPPADLRPASVETARPAPAPDEARSQVQARGRTELERAIDGRFELPSLDLSGVPDLPPAASNRPPADSEPADFSAMRFDIEAAAVIDTPEDARSQDLATRLDLAAAFAEIGDKAGARELLEQVLEEGDPQLRGRARSMLDELG